MTISFYIHYHANWGENLAIEIAGERIPLKWTDGDIWTVDLNIPESALQDYTYVVMRDGLVVRPEWEHHMMTPAEIKRLGGKAKTVTIRDKWLDCPVHGCEFLRKHQAKKFDRPGFRGAGTAVPVFSLRSEDDFGIGDFRDLRPLVDWAAKTGQCIIQLLPINDTTRQGGWEDSYPYSPVSSFALHPIYIRLQDLGLTQTKEFKAEQEELNNLSEIDYPRVFRAKMKWIRKAFEKRGSKDLSTKAYQKFYTDNADWLGEYCEFCALRDESSSPEFHAWMQFHLDKQLSEEVAYARSKGISFKGDLPIGVSDKSADAYWHPELFNLDSTAGAPPDFFSKDGQNWGFPTYNWDEMEKDGFDWWKRRLKHMAKYFDAFRIDHILGFFRIWEIPAEEKSGMFGHFNPALPYKKEEIVQRGLPLENLFHEDPRHKGEYQPLISADTSTLEDWQKERFWEMYNDFFFHRHNEFWRESAEKKLDAMLGSTGMLACGEDLGMIPDCVNDVMAKERILSLEMACMEKGRPWPYLSVCTTSSHDMATLRMQFNGNNGRDMDPAEAKNTLASNLNSASMLAIFPIQDWLAIDEGLRRKDFLNEQINDPSNSSHHWRFRLHLNLEELVSEKASNFNLEITSLLRESARENR